MRAVRMRDREGSCRIRFSDSLKICSTPWVVVRRGTLERIQKWEMGKKQKGASLRSAHLASLCRALHVDHVVRGLVVLVRVLGVDLCS